MPIIARKLGAIPVAALLLAASLCPSCSSPYRESPDPPADQGTGGKREESLFAERIDEHGESVVDFETSDPAYLSPRGYTLWSLKAPPQAEFLSRRVLADKLSGYGATGFGITFCHRQAENPADETMIVAMVNIEQEYIVGEAKGAAFSPLVEWTSSTALKRGYDRANEIRVELDRERRTFTLYLNGTEACEFTPSDSDYELGGGNGYIAVVSPRETFPDRPVHVAFKEQS